MKKGRTTKPFLLILFIINQLTLFVFLEEVKQKIKTSENFSLVFYNDSKTYKKRAYLFYLVIRVLIEKNKKD
jgi:hypothetical protein